MQLTPAKLTTAGLQTQACSGTHEQRTVFQHGTRTYLGKSCAMAAMLRASAFLRQISIIPTKWLSRCTALLSALNAAATAAHMRFAIRHRAWLLIASDH